MLKSQKATGIGSVYTKNIPIKRLCVLGTVVGIVIIGGTVAEDFLSGGIGVTDDAASFALAYKLILDN